MGWDRAAGTDPKYRTREHREYCTALKQQLERDGYLLCCEDNCLFDDFLRLVAHVRGMKTRDPLRTLEDCLLDLRVREG